MTPKAGGGWPTRVGLALTIVMLLAAPTTVEAQLLNLTVSPLLVTFPSTGDPDTVPLLVAPPMTIQYRVRQNNFQPWMLTVVANGNLASGPSQINISAVTWVATPAPPFRNGTMSSTQAQIVASGTGNVNPTTTGTVTLRLANSWNYDTGTYLAIVTFTLSAP